MENSYKINEIRVHYNRPELSSLTKVSTSEEVVRTFRECIDQNVIDLKEFFWVMFLSRSNHVLGISEIGSGNTHAVMVNIKEIFQLALKANANSVILCHNHPSGNLNASHHDIQITKSLKAFGKMIDVQIIDHMIITSESYLSFVDNGLM